jgi:WD40 repeat protein
MLQSFRATSRSVTSVAFSRDGRSLAVGSSDLVITLWEVGTWKEVRALKGHSGAALSLAFHPDGSRLAYVRLADFSEPGRLAIMEPSGPTTLVDTGVGHIDGPEWSPDGSWIYLNTEAFTDEPGHAQLARVPDDGLGRDGAGTADAEVERLATSATVDWFPHLSPDGRLATYISFPTGTLGHPADLDVEVRLVDTRDWSAPLRSYQLFGGQGTLNVNSWSPDSRRFAFVAYPVA